MLTCAPSRTRSAPERGVVEIGTGVGFFAVVACRTGAERVYAIEPDPAIHVGAELARVNGCSDRIEFIQNVSTRVSLDPVDVMVSDLRGVLPLLDEHIPAIVDARRRLLKPGGIQIPARDTLWMTLTEGVGDASGSAAPGKHGIDLEPLDRVVANVWRGRRFKAGQMMSASRAWHTIDYRTVTTPDLGGSAELEVDRDGTVAGIGVWFETELYLGTGFSSAPGSDTVYGHAFFPIPGAIRLRRGDVMTVTLRCKLVRSRYVWTWQGRVLSGAARDREFAQSTFHGVPIDPATLRKRADRFVARLGRDGHAQTWLLSQMSDSVALGDIVREATARFPDVFPDFQRALGYVADLSQHFSE